MNENTIVLYECGRNKERNVRNEEGSKMDGEREQETRD
jgi:hypothetical protein